MILHFLDDCKMPHKFCMKYVDIIIMSRSSNTKFIKDDIVFILFTKDKVEIIKDDIIKLFTHNKKKIRKLYDMLKKNANEDNVCFNTLHPWNDFVNLAYGHSAVFIAYNTLRNIIEGWCNLLYKDFEYNGMINDVDNGTSIYYLEIDKLVTRSEPKRKGLGTYMMNYIKNNMMNNVDILFLYSLSTSITFYRKLLFLTEEIYENKHIFYVINPNSRINYNQDILESLKILWEFEGKTNMTQLEKENYIKNMTYISTNFKEHCDIYKNNSIINQFDSSQTKTRTIRTATTATRRSARISSQSLGVKKHIKK